MAGRGNGRGRGGRGGTFKQTQRPTQRPNDQKSVHDRLGRMPVYPKKYKYVKPTVVTSTIATVPGEPRIRALSKRFLKSYYEIFDSPGRANLESQYSADAFFSFSATIPMPTYGRNLIEIREPENRIRLLVHDKTNIAQALACFSPTEHLVNCLSSDVPFYIANTMSIISMQIVVTGVFKDLSEPTNPLKAFTRVFILKLVSIDSQGEPVYHIFNDLFMLQPPTPEQIKRYHSEAAIAKRISSNTPGNHSSKSYEQIREEMIQSIMAKTKMNKPASAQLLEENNWDDVESMNAFNKLLGLNKIPQHFFSP